ncbi:DUF2256 domain-containing protein [Tepidamorphus sp. 3E244]|uniref:DUF2256 domain-containing protein n=1 Tax=Tepidamorphus sp. 3E244 TaxID=3385498 RepID=UPI0038FBF6DB
MAKSHRKADLPTKTCKTCGRPFAWRKKWERGWEQVLYCSQRCAREARSGKSEKDNST